MRLAIDIGGTFTDIVLENQNNLITKKVLTSIAQPEVAVIEGVSELLDENNITSSEIKMIIHGTTLATNAVIERKGAKTCFITTEGFRDVLDIGQPEEVKIKDLAALIIEKTGSNSKVKFITHEEEYGKAFEDPMRRTPGIDKIVNLTNVSPSKKLDEMLDEIIKFKLKN